MEYAACPKGLLKDLSRIVRDTASRRAASPLGHITSCRICEAYTKACYTLVLKDIVPLWYTPSDMVLAPRRPLGLITNY